MPLKKYAKGASRERRLIHIALSRGATLAVRGAGSKAYAPDEDLKVDSVIFKDNFCYLVQSKNMEKHNDAERRRFYGACLRNKLQGKYFFVKAVYVENVAEFEKLMSK